MGSSESRIESNKVEEIEANQTQVPNVSVSISPGLISSIKGQNENGATVTKSHEEENIPIISNNEAQKKDHSEKVEDVSKKKESLEQVDQSSAIEEEVKKVQNMIDELNKTRFRAPIGAVQCSDEREACVKCYSENVEAVLTCKEISDKFIQCAQTATKKFVQA